MGLFHKNRPTPHGQDGHNLNFSKPVTPTHIKEKDATFNKLASFSLLFCSVIVPLNLDCHPCTQLGEDGEHDVETWGESPILDVLERLWG